MGSLLVGPAGQPEVLGGDGHRVHAQSSFFRSTTGSAPNGSSVLARGRSAALAQPNRVSNKNTCCIAANTVLPRFHSPDLRSLKPTVPGASRAYLASVSTSSIVAPAASLSVIKRTLCRSFWRQLSQRIYAGNNRLSRIKEKNCPTQI